MAESCKVGPDYPEFVERNGRRYSVAVETDRDGMIEYFHLIDILTEEIFFEADYQVSSLTEDQIREIVDELNGVEESAELEGAAKAYEADAQAEAAAAAKAKRKERKRYAKLLEERYPHYGDLGDEFRDEAIDALSRHQNESRAFQDILLDELAEEFEED